MQLIPITTLTNITIIIIPPQHPRLELLQYQDRWSRHHPHIIHPILTHLLTHTHTLLCILSITTHIIHIIHHHHRRRHHPRIHIHILTRITVYHHL
jgi:hypothetical protein